MFVCLHVDLHTLPVNWLPAVRIYTVNRYENKEKILNEKVCLNLWLIVYTTDFNAVSKHYTAKGLWTPFLMTVFQSHFLLKDVYDQAHSHGIWTLQ